MSDSPCNRLNMSNLTAASAGHVGPACGAVHKASQQKLNRANTSDWEEKRSRKSRTKDEQRNEKKYRASERDAGLESAASKFVYGCKKVLQRSASRNNVQAKQPDMLKYVPSVEAKVRRTWFTRRDQDGRVVLVQVEEGIDEHEPTKRSSEDPPGDAKTRAPLIQRLFSKDVHEADEHKDPFTEKMHDNTSYIHPQSFFIRAWDVLVLLMCSAYFVLVVPLRIAFPQLWPTVPLVVLDATCSFFLLFDVMLRFFVAYEDSDFDAEDLKNGKVLYSSTNQDTHLVVSRDLIASRHLHRRFWFGLLAALPLDLIVFATTGANWAVEPDDSDIDYASGLTALPSHVLVATSVAAYAGLLRLACISNLIYYFHEGDYSVSDNQYTIFDRILKNMLVGAFGAHWLACGFVKIAVASEIAGRPSHLSAPAALQFYEHIESAGVGARYARAIYWAFITMSGVGYGDVTPVSIGEAMYVSVAAAVGTSFFLLTVGSVTSLIMSSDAVNAQIKAKLSALKKWMSRAGLPPEMRIRVLENFYDQHASRRMGMEDRSMIAELPKFLQHEVAMYLNQDIVKSTALFRGCSPAIVASIVENIQAHRCLPLDLVVHKGDVADELYLIKKGLFEVLNDDGTVHRMLGAGSYFGEVGLLCRVHRTMTVRAVTMGLVFVVERQLFEMLMDRYPADRNQLLLSAALRYRNKAKTGYTVGEKAAKRVSGDFSMNLPFGKHGRTRGSCVSMQRKVRFNKRGSLKEAMPAFLQGLSPDLSSPPSAKSSRRDRWKNGKRASLDMTTPLAFLPSSAEDVDALRTTDRLQPILSTPSERLAQKQDEEVVRMLRRQAEDTEQRHRVRTSLDLDEDADATDGAGEVARGRKSIYHENRDKLKAALDLENDSFNSGSPSFTGGSAPAISSAQGYVATEAQLAQRSKALPPPSATGTSKVLGWLEC